MVYVCICMQFISNLMLNSVNIVGLQGRRVESIAMNATKVHESQKTNFIWSPII